MCNQSKVQQTALRKKILGGAARRATVDCGGSRKRARPPQNVSIFDGAIVGFCFASSFFPDALKSKSHSCASARRCSPQNTYSHLHLKPSRPTFLLQVQQRLVFSWLGRVGVASAAGQTSADADAA